MDKLADQLSQTLSKLQDPGLAAARQAVRLDAMTKLVTGGVLLIFCLLAIGAIVWVSRAKPFGDDAEDVLPPALLLGVVALLLFVWSLTSFLNPWVWVAFTDPDVILAAKILNI